MSKLVKVREFVKQCFEERIFSPQKMADEYNKLYGLKGKQKKTRQAFTMAMRRMGISAKDRMRLKEDGLKEKEVLDITEYPEVKRYLAESDFQQIATAQKKRTIHYLRRLWQCARASTYVLRSG